MTNQSRKQYLNEFQTSIAALVASDWSPERISLIPLMAEQGIREGHESTLLWALAGEKSNANSFELEDSFKRALKQMAIKLPDFKRAVETMIAYYCHLSLSQPSEVVVIVRELIFEVVCSSQQDLIVQSFGKDSRYAHDNLGIQVASLYGLYYAYDELNNIAEYYSAENISKEKTDIEHAMLDECKKYTMQMDNEGHS